MAQYEDVRGEVVYGTGEAISGWAVGFIIFAAAMMIMIGTFHVIAGLAALFNEDFYVVRPGYDLELDTQAWGWLHIVGGIIVGLAGMFLITGATWARLVAIVVAFLSAIYSFYSIPYYPVWSILILALDIGVIWALIAHGRELSNA
jgi:hypothetical protein